MKTTAEKLQTIIEENDTYKYSGTPHAVASDLLKYINGGMPLNELCICENELYSREAIVLTYAECTDTASWLEDWELPTPDVGFTSAEEWIDAHYEEDEEGEA